MSTETPGSYGWNATAEHRAHVEQLLARQREQTARRRAEARAAREEAAR